MKNKIEVEHIFISLTLKQNKNKNKHNEPESNQMNDWSVEERDEGEEENHQTLLLSFSLQKKKKHDKEHGNERPRSFPEIWFLDVHTDDNVDGDNDDLLCLRFINDSLSLFILYMFENEIGMNE